MIVWTRVSASAGREKSLSPYGTEQVAAVSLISNLDAGEPETFARRFTPLVTDTARRIAQDQILPE